jgi:hypothetical protein
MQVLTKAVKPPTPDATKLAAVVPQQQLAMQHVRMQLARMVKKAHPAQVCTGTACSAQLYTAALQSCGTTLSHKPTADGWTHSLHA